MGWLCSWLFFFFFSSRRRHTRFSRDWSSDVCSSDLAFDALTGDLLWQFNTGAGVHGGPITYAVDGVQYVAVAAGGNYQLGTPKGDEGEIGRASCRERA